MLSLDTSFFVTARPGSNLDMVLHKKPKSIKCLNRVVRPTTVCQVCSRSAELSDGNRLVSGYGPSSTAAESQVLMLISHDSWSPTWNMAGP